MSSTSKLRHYLSLDMLALPGLMSVSERESIILTRHPDLPDPADGRPHHHHHPDEADDGAIAALLGPAERYARRRALVPDRVAESRAKDKRERKAAKRAAEGR